MSADQRAWVLWTWDQTHQTWREARAGSQDRMVQLADERTAQAADIGIPGAKFVALPVGQKPDIADAPGVLPLELVAPVATITPHPHECWRLPSHHDCAILFIEQQLAQYRQLLDYVAELERSAARQPA